MPSICPTWAALNASSFSPRPPTGGLKAARARGRNGGRPKKLSAKELKTMRTLLRSNEVAVQDIAAQFKVSRSTLYLYRNMNAA